MHAPADVAAALAAAHGVRAVLDDRTAASGGVDNQLFHATLDPAGAEATGWPAQVAVRVGWNEGSIATAERLRLLMAWCGDRGYPVVPVLASGTVGGTGYTVMPFVDARPSLFVLRRPWRLGPFIERMVELQERLHATDPSGWPGTTLTVASAVADVERAAGPVPEARRMLDWVVANHAAALDDQAPVACHLDLHPLNVLWRWGDEPMVIDWDTAALAPRAADVAFTVELTSLGGAAVPSRATRAAAVPAGQALGAAHLRRSLARADVDPGALRWWRALLVLQATLWARGITVMGTAPRPDASASVPPELARLAGRRFERITGHRP